MMSKYRALYYPSWNPPVPWFRSALLFYDQIQVIRPAEVDDPEYLDGNKAVIDLIPHAFSEIRKKHYEMTLNARNMTILEGVLNEIQRVKRPNRSRIREVIHNGGCSIPGYVFLHISKIPPNVLEALRSRSLILEQAEVMLRETKGLENFRIVERNAAGVILALIADHYGRHNALRTITDEPLGYLASALNKRTERHSVVAEGHLASAIMKIQVPSQIEQLSAKKYVELRERFADHRETFQHAVRTICDDQMLIKVTTRKQFDEAVREAARDFSMGVDDILRKSWAVRLGKWSTFSVGIISSACKFGDPVTAKVGAGLDICLKILAFVRKDKFPSETSQAQNMFATLRQKLLTPAQIRKIVN